MNLAGKIKTILGSNWFLGFIIFGFVFQSAWIAVRTAFPMAFDENYHLGIIQLHAAHWLPYFSNLPDSTAQYGALATDPSYLFHYLLSFPYRLLTVVTNDQAIIVVALRFINIAFFATAILVFRNVLTHMKISKALSHVVLLFFTLLPLQSFTAAHINYDNLMFLLTALVLLTTLKFTKSLFEEKKIDGRSLLLAVSLCLLATQVKYVFMPILVAIYGYIAIIIYIANRKKIINRSDYTWNVRRIFKSSGIIVGVLFIVSVGLFSWRFGYNVVAYQALVPKCEIVVNAESCSAYNVWQRNSVLEKSHTPQHSVLQLKIFIQWWIYIVGNQLFSILNTNGGRTEAPVRHLVYGTAVIVFIGSILVLRQLRHLMGLGYAFWLFVTVIAVYLSALIFQNYTDFIRYGIPIAVQGRYLLPILILIMAIIAQAYAKSLHGYLRYRVSLLLLALIVFTQGGGILTYIKRTDDSWYWAHTNSVAVPKEVVNAELVGSSFLN